MITNTWLSRICNNSVTKPELERRRPNQWGFCHNRQGCFVKARDPLSWRKTKKLYAKYLKAISDHYIKKKCIEVYHSVCQVHTWRALCTGAAPLYFGKRLGWILRVPNLGILRKLLGRMFPYAAVRQRSGCSAPSLSRNSGCKGIQRVRLTPFLDHKPFVWVDYFSWRVWRDPDTTISKSKHHVFGSVPLWLGLICIEKMNSIPQVVKRL